MHMVNNNLHMPTVLSGELMVVSRTGTYTLDHYHIALFSFHIHTHTNTTSHIPGRYSTTSHVTTYIIIHRNSPTCHVI